MTIIQFQSIDKDRYLNPHQAKRRAATSYEDLLGDAIEHAFAAGHWELDTLVAHLNKTGPLASNSLPWTAGNYAVEMKRLAQG